MIRHRRSVGRPNQTPGATPGSPDHALDVIIVGGGIGGLICLKYADDAGLRAVVLEREDRVGGLWRDLPSWQDIQFRREDWTLGDLPIDGEDQASILRNIEAWAERFELAPRIRLGEPVRRARPVGDGWSVTTDAATWRARWLIAATGAHNRPVVPPVERDDPTVEEHHSSELRDPDRLRGRRVTVVGGGASAYDLLDLAFDRGARSVAWVYRSTRWMRPTLKPKYHGTDMRLLARSQMLGTSVDELNRGINEDLRRRYTKAGIESIMPESDFDIRYDQVIPGRRGMLASFSRIDRRRAEVRSIRGDEVHLSDGTRIGTDVLLWGTGYTMDLRWLDVDALQRATRSDGLAARCYSGFRSCDAPHLFLLAPGVLETTTSTPWAYAHVAKSVMAHIAGRPVFEDAPEPGFTNHFDLVKRFARRDRAGYPRLLWRLKYLRLALLHPKSRPMPIP